MRAYALATPLILGLVAGCRERAALPDPEPPAGASTMQLHSVSFGEGDTIPQQHTCDGKDVSPFLKWSGAPASTKSFALICDDPDAPRGTWVHWVVYDLPSSLTELPEAVPAQATLPHGGVQGTNDFKKIGYGGPCPPKGKPHRYFFKLYALDATLNLPAGATKNQVVEAMTGHVLAEGRLMGKYSR